MTREEAKNQFLCNDLIDEIYDYFESRTCRNCKWYKDVGESFKVCKLYDIAHGKDFSCSKYEASND